jgi:hypothetical protein
LRLLAEALKLKYLLEDDDRFALRSNMPSPRGVLKCGVSASGEVSHDDTSFHWFASIMGESAVIAATALLPENK